MVVLVLVLVLVLVVVVALLFEWRGRVSFCVYLLSLVDVDRSARKLFAIKQAEIIVHFDA